MRRPLISIVMLTRNRLAFTSQCLDSVSLTDYPIEWVIIDNGSKDETKDYLLRWAENNRLPVKFIWNLTDPGSCRARNQGVEAARGELVLFLDNDVMLEDRAWLDKLALPLVKAQEKSNEGSGDLPVVATAPLLLFPGGSGLVQCAGGGVTPSGRVGLIGRGQQDGDAWAQPRAISWAPTAALLIDKATLLKIGGFDEGFDPVSVCEDIDLCCRLRAAGGRILFVGASRLQHFEGITFNHLGYDKRAYWLRHMRIIKNRWVDVLTEEPLYSNEEMRWQPVIKDYSDLKRPIVRLPDLEEQNQNLPQFFSPFLDLIDRTSPSPRLAVIGCGQAARLGALPGFSPPGSEQAQKAAPFLSFDGAPDVKLSAVCDLDEDRAIEAAKQFDVPRIETVLDRVLDDVPLEAVCICSPPFEHARQSLAALTRGIPVLVEKPPVVNEAELNEVIAEKERHGNLPVMVNIPWAFHPAVEAASKLIAADGLGKIEHLDALFEHSGPENWAPDARWYRERGAQTLVLDLALHVAFTAERLLRSHVKFLNSVAHLRRAEYQGARFLIGDVDTFFAVGWDAERPRFRFNISGTEASLSMNLIPWRAVGLPSSIQVKLHTDRAFSGELKRGQGESLWLPHPAVPLFGGPYRHFIECLKANRTPISDILIISNATREVLRWAAEVPGKWCLNFNFTYRSRKG